MSKFTPRQKLPNLVRQNALFDLCQAVVSAKKLPDAARILGDLLSGQEIDMIAKRLQIAKQLLDGKIYDEIIEDLRVSRQTVARVNIWLQQGGAGYRTVIAKRRNMKIPAKELPDRTAALEGNWGQIKRRYPMYYWPQLLLEDIVRSANLRQRRRLLGTLKILRESGKGKKEAFRHLEEILRAERKSPRGRQQIKKEA